MKPTAEQYGMDPARFAAVPGFSPSAQTSAQVEPTPTKARIVAALTADPKTDQQRLANELGCSLSYVNRFATQLGIRKYRRVTREFEQAVRSGFFEGLSDVKIAKRCRCTVGRVQHVRVAILGLHRHAWARIVWTAERDARLRELVGHRLSDEDIARVLGGEWGFRVTEHAVHDRRVLALRLLRKGGGGQAMRRLREENERLLRIIDELETRLAAALGERAA